MGIFRREFMGKAAAVSAGLAALARGAKLLAMGLPSDPDAAAGAAGADEIALPPFPKTAAFTLDQALLERRTSRNFDRDGVITRDQLSRLCWAANGVNRPDGHRVTPSAMATYPVDVYVALAEGAYRYELKEHRLKKVTGEDLRAMIPIQSGLQKAAMKFVFVMNLDRISGGDDWMASLEVGCMVQDVYLEAAALSLGCCVFAIVQYDRVAKALGLKPKQKIRIAQAVGPLKD